MPSLRHSVLKSALQEEMAGAAYSGVRLWWLGQAGFVLSCNGMRVVIDPYLSDSLALKYKGQEFPHERMMQPPVGPEDLRDIDWVFCTHAHSDHMDPGTLPFLAKNNPDCRFVVPRAEASTAVARGIPENRLVLLNGDETLDLSPGFAVKAMPSAHENLEQDDQGNHRFLGYCLRMCGVTIYHSGDCVPYPGLAHSLGLAGVDLALLPVNGRDEYRRSRKVPGNFTIDEAIALCKEAGVPVLLAHHWGMFDFNTVPVEALQTAAASAGSEVKLVIPELNVCYEFNPKMRGRRCGCTSACPEHGGMPT